MDDNNVPEQQPEREVCGLVMPISVSEGVYTEQHWREVKSILEEAIESAGFKPNLVSDADDVGIIHTRIVGNLGENPIVVCDVSSKNPNVMFELGLRLAFDKPTIVVKDNITNYSFDTSPIEHVGYPVDLNYHSINAFKKTLKLKLEGTYKASKENPNYSTFLKHFVQYKKKLEEKTIGSEELILRKIDDLSKKVSNSYNDWDEYFLVQSIIKREVKIITQTMSKDEIANSKDILKSELIKVIREEYSSRIADKMLPLIEVHMKYLSEPLIKINHHGPFYGGGDMSFF